MCVGGGSINSKETAHTTCVCVCVFVCVSVRERECVCVAYLCDAVDLNKQRKEQQNGAPHVRSFSPHDGERVLGEVGWRFVVHRGVGRVALHVHKEDTRGR